MEINPRWLELPEDIWRNILQRLGVKEILLTAQMVCTLWRRVCKDPSMWRVIEMWDYGEFFDMSYEGEYVEMCRHAIDRSQGELVELKLAHFITEELLVYVAERSRKLKRLGILDCYDHFREGFTRIVQNLPLLEELCLSSTCITKEGFEALVHC